MSENSGRFTRERTTGSKNIKWKGDDLGYSAVHDYISYHHGQPKVCENCLVDDDPDRKYHWANMSGEYKRDFSDWARLCHICHGLIDDRTKNMRLANQQPIRTITPRNKSGYKNVFQSKRDGKYIPYVRVAKRKQKWLGKFDTAAEAYEVYKKAALDLYGEY